MKSSLGDKSFDILNYIVLISLGILMLYPFWEVLRVSLTLASNAEKIGFRLLPEKWSLAAYKEAFGNPYIWIGYRNTAIRLFWGLLVRMSFTILCAYPLSKRNLAHRNFWTMFIVFTMFFRGGLIPDFLLVRALGIRDTVWSLVLPGAIDTFAMLIMRNFFMSLPASLEESAKIDGANDFTILTRIVLPLSVPVLMTVGLWGLVAHWNAWFDCLIYIKDSNKFVLQVVLQKIIQDASPKFIPGFEDYTAKQPLGITIQMASVIVSTLPILIVYPFIQKHFMKGIMIGSLKG